MKIETNPSGCPQNHTCPATFYCPTQAIIQVGYNAPTVDNDKCIGCGKCTKVCAFKVFHLVPEPVTA